MKRAFTLVETLMSVALFGLLLLGVMQIGKNARLSYETGMQDERRQSQDELVILALKPVFDNIRGYHWHEGDQSLFLWTEDGTSELCIMNEEMILKSSKKLTRLSGEKMKSLSFTDSRKLLTVTATDALERCREYTFSLPVDSADLKKDR